MAPASPSATRSKRGNPLTDGWSPSVIPSPRGTWSRSGGVKEKVGQPILAAAGFPPALAAGEDLRRGEKPPERRLAGKIACPTVGKESCDSFKRFDDPPRSAWPGTGNCRPDFGTGFRRPGDCPDSRSARANA